MKGSSSWHVGIHAILASAMIFTVAMACGLSTNSPTTTPPPPAPLTVTDDVTSTPEPATAAPSPTEEPSFTPLPPTLEPSLEPSPIPPTPTPDPATTQAALSPNDPLGFVVDAHDGIGLTFFNRDGSLITELTAPGLSEDDPQRVHIAGPWKGDINDVPVVYYSSQGPGGDMGVEWLRIVAGKVTPVWVKVSQVFALAGAPGQPVLAYSTLDFEQSQPRCRLYAASLQNLPGAPPLFVIADPDGYIVRPLAVDADGGKLKGVWYTMAAWGIGGDIVFEPRKGLKYLDMNSGKVNEILNRDKVAWDVSFDRAWVSYSTISGPLSILNRRTGEVFTFPLLPGSNRGAGNARISPDEQYVAWMEGSGWTMTETPDFHASIRIATTAGVQVADIPQTAFDNIAGSEKASWIEPVGWLDGQTLIVQVRFSESGEARSSNNTALIRINFDGSNPLYLAAGTFVAFLYP